jgi:general stress protein 26
MKWDEFAAAAAATSWVTYLGTIDAAGRPHVSVVAPGFTPGSVWFATRRSSKKFANLVANPAVSFHWPVGNHDAPGEVIAQGRAQALTSTEDRLRVWDAGVLPYDLSAFWGSAENPDLVFVEVEVDRARLLGADFVPQRWRRSDRG